jgi:hypothetical protein
MNAVADPMLSETQWAALRKASLVLNGVSKELANPTRGRRLPIRE